MAASDTEWLLDADLVKPFVVYNFFYYGQSYGEIVTIILSNYAKDQSLIVLVPSVSKIPFFSRYSL